MKYYILIFCTIMLYVHIKLLLVRWAIMLEIFWTWFLYRIVLISFIIPTCLVPICHMIFYFITILCKKTYFKLPFNLVVWILFVFMLKAFVLYSQVFSSWRCSLIQLEGWFFSLRFCLCFPENVVISFPSRCKYTGKKLRFYNFKY